MKTRTLTGIFLILCVASSAGLLPISMADTLTENDFKLEGGWSKTVDFFNYARAYAPLLKRPPADWHAWTYVTYINTTGFQLLYCGLENITFGITATLTFPVQTFLMHYKTENTETDIVTASSFLMLMAFNETETTLFQGSPDINDVLYSSINLGVDLSSSFAGGTPPSLNSKTRVFPLTNSSDGLNWSWGMQYTNLTAIWFRTWINPDDPHFNSAIAAVSRYDELTFTYNLTIDKDSHKATLMENHVIGRMRDLWIPASWSYYNSTGHYGLFGQLKYPDNETIYSFLDEQKIEMSIIQYQTTLMIDHTTLSKAGTQNVTDNEVDVSNADITTTSDTGETVFTASFGTKKTYRLYNYTLDQNENTYDNYTAVTRTSKIRGFAFNGVISNCIAFLRYVPYSLRHINQPLYNKYSQGETLLLNVTGADYFYIISYPTYSGYRIEHDPTYTYYIAPMEESQSPPLGWGGVVVVAVVIIAILLVIGIVIRRKKHQT